MRGSDSCATGSGGRLPHPSSSKKGRHQGIQSTMGYVAITRKTTKGATEKAWTPDFLRKVSGQPDWCDPTGQREKAPPRASQVVAGSIVMQYTAEDSNL